VAVIRKQNAVGRRRQIVESGKGQQKGKTAAVAKCRRRQKAEGEEDRRRQKEEGGKSKRQQKAETGRRRK